MHVGTKALVLTQTEVDMSGKSYFGETNLYYMDSNGKFDQHVTLGTALSFPFFFLFFFWLLISALLQQTRKVPFTRSRGAPTVASLLSSMAVRFFLVFLF